MSSPKLTNYYKIKENHLQLQGITGISLSRSRRMTKKSMKVLWQYMKLCVLIRLISVRLLDSIWLASLESHIRMVTCVNIDNADVQ